VRAGPRQGNSRNPLCGRSSYRRPTLNRDSPRRKTEEPAHGSLYALPSHDPLRIPTSRRSAGREPGNYPLCMTWDIRMGWTGGALRSTPASSGGLTQARSKGSAPPVHTVKCSPKTRLNKTATLLPLDPQLQTTWRSGQLSALCRREQSTVMRGQSLAESGALQKVRLTARDRRQMDAARSR